METFVELLDALRAKAGSDNKAAPLVGIKQASFSQWRRRHSFPDDDQALAIARVLELDAAYVLAVVRASRAKSDAARAAWSRIAQAFATVLVTVAGVSGAPSPAQAAGGQLHITEAGIHIARRRRRLERAGSPLARAALAALGIGAPAGRVA